MNLSLGQSQEFVQTQSLKLTLQQRLKLENQQLQLKLQLAESVSGRTFTPTANCPECHRVLTPLEIIQGFSNDVNDFNTTCTGCGHRFRPRLTSKDSTGSIEIAFLCQDQLLSQLPGKESLKPEEIDFRHQEIYHSAIFYFGSLTRAFQEINIAYKEDDLSSWRTKIALFLGKVPDSVIAQYVPVKVATVGKYRRSLGINTYNPRLAAMEL